MSPCKSRELLVLSVAAVVVLVEVSAVKINLADLLHSHASASAAADHSLATKRMQDGNPCQEPEKPFPCKTYKQCLPMFFVCDGSYDCHDGSDEDMDMCTALNRPPVEDIQAFLQSQRKWIIPNVFGNQPIEKVAHSLAVSQSVEDLSRRLNLGQKGAQRLHYILEDVMNDDEDSMAQYDMPRSAWNEVHYFFSSLHKAGLNK